MTAVDELITDSITEEAVSIKLLEYFRLFLIAFITQLLNALDNVCPLLPDIQVKCEYLIHVFGDDILEILVDQYLDPYEVCRALGICEVSNSTVML
jgi:hypothetical protein